MGKKRKSEKRINRENYLKPKKRKSKAMFWLLALLFMATGIFAVCGAGSKGFKEKDFFKWFNGWGEGIQIELPADDENSEDESTESEFELEVEDSENAN